MNLMPVVAITGNIACGKSLALKSFKKLGAYTIDCDAIVNELYKREKIRQKLKKTFGTCSKRELAKLVLKDAAARKKLEGIVHPEVIKELNKEIIRARKKHSCIFVEVPLLFEASLASIFDFIIVVRAKRKQQIERLMRMGFTKEEALARMKTQAPLSQKVKNANFIINNISEPEKVEKQALRIFKQLGCLYGK